MLNSILIVRFGLSFVFLWFGLNQLLWPEQWTVWLPTWIDLIPGSETTHILLHGVFETTVGVLLLLGYFVRIAAIGAALGLGVIIVVIGYNDIAIRDVGLLMMAVAVATESKHEKLIDLIRYRLQK